MNTRYHLAILAAASLLTHCTESALGQENRPGLAFIPAGEFAMGDHHGFVDPKHGGDETPIHTVRLDAFYVGVNDVMTREYCAFLNSALAQKQIEVREGGVYLAGGGELLCETRGMSPYSRIGWDGKTFTVLDRKEQHPVVCIRWAGAAAYCNWLSAQQGLPACYNARTWDCDFNRSGYRLPTEAEWEYAARGGQKQPYWNFPWANEADPAKANWPESKNPYRMGPQPWTTPVGFFNGQLQRKTDFGWPGAQESFQTSNGANGYGLYDMAGNVWQFVNDWYERSYYAYSPTNNPPGPERGSLMPDGKPYRGMRGGNWFNGENGHSRVSNRNPSYWRGPLDPSHPYYHVGFRVALPVNAESRPVVKLTPVQRVASNQQGQGGGRPEQGGGVAARGQGGFRLLPPRAQEQLNLTATQQKQLADLEAEAKAKLDKILTPEQQQQLRQVRSPQGQGGNGGGNPGPAASPDSRPRRSEGSAQGGQESVGSASAPGTGFVLRSPEVAQGGTLPKDYTGDGTSATLPMEWSGAPAGTKSYALIMHHIDPQGATKWYWTLYDIPANVQSLPRNVKSVGTLGNNSINGRVEYAPPHSKGPGEKTYIYTVYALSGAPQVKVPAAQVSREVLLAAMKGLVLATAELKVVHSRPEGATEAEAGRSLGTERKGLLSPALSSQGGEGELQDGRRDQVRPDSRAAGQGGGGAAEVASVADSDRRPSRPEGQAGKQKQGGGGGRIIEGNKLPTSPNPGQTVGLFLNTTQACPGYTLMAPKHNTVTYLLNNEGRIVNQWKSAYEPGQSAYLLPNGHLVRAGMVRVRGGTGGGEGGRIEEYDWEGKLVWEFEHATPEHQLHHDIRPMPNGHIIALMVERKSREEVAAAGFDVSMMRDDYLAPDAVVEIEPIRPKGGRIVWEWHVWDHLVQGFDRTKANYGDPAAHPELIDVACNGRGAPAFWNHMNSIDYNAKLDQVVLSVRGDNEIWFLDHSTTAKEAAGHTGGKHGKGGDLIYRWGNPAAYKRGTMSDKQLVQQHGSEWIPDGYPGAGHLTIFNNGYDRGWSSIEEIVPPLDASGRYVLAAGKAYGPDKPVWLYEAKNRTDFFSSEISGAHRLPNGNTLICAGVIGNLFEVTPGGETVWQYVNPMVRGGILAQGEVPGKDMRGHLWNAVFKVHRYAPDYPGLAGRDLTPKGVVELPASQKGKTGLDNLSEQPRPNRNRPEQGSQPRQQPRN